MTAVRRRSISATLALLVTASCAIASCTSWQRTRVPPGQAPQARLQSRMRLELTDGRVVYLRDPWFGSDTLYGRMERKIRGAAKGDTLAVPIEWIAKLEARRFSGTKTAIFVAGAGATAALVAAAAAELENWGIGGGGVGSCPRIYSWDGAEWRLDSGTFGGAIMPALARTDVDNLDRAVAPDGVVRLRVTGVDGETEHVDAIRLLVVDHEPDCAIAPDAAGALHTLGSLGEPSAAHDFRARDVLRLVRSSDAVCWESVPAERDTARADDVRDGLEIEFPRPPGMDEARLLIDGRYTAWAEFLMSQYIELHGRDTQAWYRSLAEDPARAREFASALAREAFLEVSVWGDAHWRRQGFVPGAGPELSKRQIVRIDLAGVSGRTVRVRLETAPSLWMIDRVAIDFGPERKFVVTEARLLTANDSRGRDVRSELDHADGRVQVMEGRDSVDLRFGIPPAAAGRARSYLAATTGWYRIHTPESADPEWALADRLVREPRAISRLSVARLNGALRSMRLH